jgi:hypothetical protein
MHVSDSPKNGEKEISIWFSKEELIEWLKHIFEISV